MCRVDFIITNPNHHLDASLPVIQNLLARPQNYKCRIISLCELRGFETPSLDDKRIEILKIIPLQTPARRGDSSVKKGRQVYKRQLAKRIVWWMLKLRFLWCFRKRPSMVVTPNDFAYPYDMICALMRQKNIPFMLLQEGIRFPWQGVAPDRDYGSGGALIIAAWGENSVAYFRKTGAPLDSIIKTGSPRIEKIRTMDWQAEAERLKQQHGIGETHLLLLSNPIDDQGFCTTAEKMALVKRFLVEIASLFEEPAFHLTIKLHPRESTEAFQAIAGSLDYASQITVLREAPLYALFELSQAAIVFASTVGLEALLVGLPLGVLEIPGEGFIFDYVAQGAARGLTWTQPMAEQVRTLLEEPVPGHTVEAFLKHNFAFLDGATQHLADLIAHQVTSTGRPVNPALFR